MIVAYKELFEDESAKPLPTSVVRKSTFKRSAPGKAPPPVPPARQARGELPTPPAKEAPPPAGASHGALPTPPQRAPRQAPPTPTTKPKFDAEPLIQAQVDTDTDDVGDDDDGGDESSGDEPPPPTSKAPTTGNLVDL